jgi:hypothetical protein
MFLHFFGQLADKLVEAMTRVTKLIDAKFWELLGLARTRILSNLQRLRPDLDLLDVLQRRAARMPPDTPDCEAVARATRMDAAI